METELSESFKNSGEMTEGLIKSLQSAKATWFKETLKKYAKPPLTGEITKGKLKWRGIVLCEQPSHNKSWITQRGEKIGDEFVFTINQNY